jgi:hypothetical protein
MPQVMTADLGALRQAMGGQVLAPGDPGYDDARTVWSRYIDSDRP